MLDRSTIDRFQRQVQEDGMALLIRGLLTFVSGIGVLYFTYWAGGALFYSLDLTPLIPFFGSLVAGALAARYVWIHTTGIQPGFVSSVVLGAVTTGAIAFSAGFFGPMIFAPGANQGPLLGIFITGPLGFVLGAIGGAVYWFVKRRQASP